MTLVAVIRWEVVMPFDPVPGLLARATEVLAAKFSALPAFDPSPQADSEMAAMTRVLE